MASGWVVSALLTALIAIMVSSVSARVCTFMIDLDSHGCSQGMGRFVLPPGDPCTCTGVRLGGHYHRYESDMQGHDPPLYINMLLEVTVEVIGRWFNCTAREPEDSTLGVTTTTQESTPKLDLRSTPVASTSAVATSTDNVLPVDCQEIFDAGQTTSGVYTIQHAASQYMTVYCRMESGKGYIVFQRRLDGSVSFDRTWQEYAEGFGNMTGEFWLGNQKLSNLTYNPVETEWELVVTLRPFDGNEGRVRYMDFKLYPSWQNYYVLVALSVDERVHVGDPLKIHNELPFSTQDRDNDEEIGENCAQKFQGGWWYSHCGTHTDTYNLNSLYYNNAAKHLMGIQVILRDHRVSLKGCEMMIRRKP